jgi:hypothetical protein
VPVSQVGIKEGRKGEQAQGLGTVKVKGSELQKIGLFFTSTNKSLRQFGFILLSTSEGLYKEMRKRTFHSKLHSPW